MAWPDQRGFPLVTGDLGSSETCLRLRRHKFLGRDSAVHVGQPTTLLKRPFFNGSPVHMLAGKVQKARIHGPIQIGRWPFVNVLSTSPMFLARATEHVSVRVHERRCIPAVECTLPTRWKLGSQTGINGLAHLVLRRRRLLRSSSRGIHSSLLLLQSRTSC